MNKKNVTCPTAITTYNMQSAGVDKGDQLQKYYSVRLKYNKNYKIIYILVSFRRIYHQHIYFK